VTSIEAPVTLSDLDDMESAFVTNAAVGIRPVRSIDHSTLPEDPPVLELLRHLYLSIPEEEL